MAALIAILSVLALAAVSPAHANVDLKTIIKSCPSRPLQYCDFYFNTYKFRMPNFLLKNPRTDYNVTTSKLRYHVIDYSKDVAYDNWAGVDNTGREIYFSGPPIVSQFYLNGHPASYLTARTFNQPLGNFRNRCIVLPLPNVQVRIKGKVINLGPNDNNTLFSKKRRCVVFRTR